MPDQHLDLRPLLLGLMVLPKNLLKNQSLSSCFRNVNLSLLLDDLRPIWLHLPDETFFLSSVPSSQYQWVPLTAQIGTLLIALTALPSALSLPDPLTIQVRDTKYPLLATYYSLIKVTLKDLAFFTNRSSPCQDVRGYSTNQHSPQFQLSRASQLAPPITCPFEPKNHRNKKTW